MTATTAATFRAPIDARRLPPSATGWMQGLLARLLAAPQPPAPASHHLAKNRMVFIEQPLGRRITCESGCVWITVDGQARDLVLDAGDRFECAGQARVGVFALDDAHVRVA